MNEINTQRDEKLKELTDTSNWELILARTTRKPGNTVWPFCLNIRLVSSGLDIVFVRKTESYAFDFRLWYCECLLLRSFILGRNDHLVFSGFIWWSN